MLRTARCAVRCSRTRSTQPRTSLGNPGHRLFKYSDAATHWDCFAKWPDRDEFARLYFDAVRADAVGNKYWPVISELETILVRFGVAINEISVVLRKIGTDHRVKRPDWSRWLKGGYIESCNHPLEQEAVEEALPFLRTIRLP
jgi:hypothetical protein